MKLSLIAAATLAALALVACDDSDGSGGPPPRNTTAEEPPAEAPPAAQPRKLVEGDVLPTSPTNLLMDPGFGLAGQQAGFGAFLTFVDGSFDMVDVKTTTDSRSPAGFGGGVAILEASGATNTKSDPLMMLTSFQGGQGPFHAQVWVAKNSIAGNPLDVPTDKKQLRISVVDGTPDGTAYDLDPVDAATRVVGGRTWVLFRATIPNAIPFGGYFVVRTGDGGGKYLVAAPEVVADAVTGAAATKSLAARATSRARTSSERTAITKYRSLPPRLVPATAKKPM